MSFNCIAKFQRATILVALLYMATLVGQSPAFALQNKGSKNVGIITQPVAIVKAKEFAGGRVLRVDNTPTGFRVKLLQQSGRVISLDINRATGEITQFHSTEQKKGK
jgi:hypothetical protein